MKTTTNLLNTHQAGALIEAKLKAAKVSMRGTGFNLLTESRLTNPRGFGAGLSSQPPKIQKQHCKKVRYNSVKLSQWIDNVLIPALRLNAGGVVLEPGFNERIQSTESPPQSGLKFVQKNLQEPFTEKEAFLGALVTLSFKFAETVIRNDTFRKDKYGATPVEQLRSTIALDIINSATGVDILKQFNLTHAPH
jgi:hypothetical protein